MANGFNINEFKQRGPAMGGARPSQFKVLLNGNAAFLPANVLQDFEFFVSAASLPSFITESVQVPYFGRMIKFAGDRVFQDWQVEVLNDANFRVRDMFEAWSNAINALISNRMDAEAWPTGYKQTASVIQYAQNGDEIRRYSFFGLFPTQIDAIGLSWAAANQIESFNVNFSYDYFELIDPGPYAQGYNAVLPGDGTASGGSTVPPL